jgi:hypothetical protein
VSGRHCIGGVPHDLPFDNGAVVGLSEAHKRVSHPAGVWRGQLFDRRYRFDIGEARLTNFIRARLAIVPRVPVVARDCVQFVGTGRAPTRAPVEPRTLRTAAALERGTDELQQVLAAQVTSTRLEESGPRLVDEIITKRAGRAPLMGADVSSDVGGE